MLQAANIDLFNPLPYVPKAHNSECQNRVCAKALTI